MLERAKQKLAAGEMVRVIVYGDSISESHTPTCGNYHGGAGSHDAWYGKVLERLLAERFGEGKFFVQSFGVGGHNSYEGCGRVNYLGLYFPDVVLVSFGANDAGWHVIPPEATHTALTRLVECVRWQYKSDVVMVGMGGWNPRHPAGWRHPEETLAAVRRVAAEVGAPYANVRDAILQATGNGERWTDFHNGLEDCHPNDAGHAVWAKTIFECIVDSLTR